MHNSLKLIAGTVFCVSLMAAPNTYARQLMENDGLRATIDPSFKCSDSISLSIDTQNINEFQGDGTKLQKLMGGVRAALSFECDKIERINIVGKVNSETVYHAYVQSQDNWRLTNSVTDCDYLAADPHDPQKYTSGVSTENIDADSAIDACMIALENDTENPRLQYQLARALSIAGEEDAALEFYELADESGYSAASYHLGEIFFLAEDGGEEYFDVAMAYYKDAADGGYAPAKEVASEFDDYFKERSLNIREMRRGQWLSNFIKGHQVKKTKDNQYYLNGIAKRIVSKCGEPETPDVRSAYYELQIKEFTDIDKKEVSTGSSFIDQLAAYNEIYSKQFPERLEAFTVITAGEYDAGLFISRHGCWGYLINRLNEQISLYATGQEISISDSTGLAKPIIGKD